ncbi:selenium cofactor biosynthesis protein YqeC [uncultured Subdoligranulum sp.]|uniref:selenium cofactor biosynthesis protein YqeC n=1 Tax=uncultured Subdoligranulum sp. TaxID=512298 RepID=UPI0025D5A320|nr:selenium cofactor biosynthesis protein YqeC [uncultured Subdoligranulum sp.]
MKACIAIIGAGGKTTAMRCLAHRLSAFSVLWTTTTHIFPAGAADCRRRLDAPTAEELRAALARPGVVCAGMPAGEKFTALPPAVWAAGCEAADYILCEADGAHRLPLKLHRPDEPVLPAETTHCLAVLGLSALGRPVGEVVHRYALHPAWAARPDTPVGVAELCACARETVAASGLPQQKIRLLFNQADDGIRLRAGRQAAAALTREGFVCRVGALQRSDDFLLPWLLER